MVMPIMGVVEVPKEVGRYVMKVQAKTDQFAILTVEGVNGWWVIKC